MCGNRSRWDWLVGTLGSQSVLMLLVLLQLVGLPLLGIYLALLAVIATIRRRSVMRSISLAATSVTACLFGALWFLDDGHGWLKSGILTAIASCLWAFAVAWTRLQVAPAVLKGEIWWKALGVSLIPAMTFIGTALGYYLGAAFPHLLSDRWGVFWGQIVGFVVGCGIAVSLALMGSRGRFCLVAVGAAIAIVGFIYLASAYFEPADNPVIVVAASYPGASAQLVADAVGAPIEQQINGVEWLVRIESTSGNDGKYAALLYFKPRTDLESVMKLVQNRVALAEPVLPDLVLKNKVSVQVGEAEADRSKVAIAVIDQGAHDWKELEHAAGAVVNRLTAEDALTKPQVFPRDEKQVTIDIDRAKCASLGVPLEDVNKAIRVAGPAMKPDILKNAIVRDKLTLGDVATIKEAFGPGAVYRVDLYPAIRITGAPPEGKSMTVAGAKCVDLAEVEMKRLDFQGFATKNLSVK
jgi:hypothetical protein